MAPSEATRGGAVSLAAVSADSTTVVAALGTVQGQIGDVRTLLLPGGDPPAPRSNFTAVLSATQQAVYVLGGNLTKDGGQSAEIWRYGVPVDNWMLLPAPHGVTLGKVLAAVYRQQDRSLYVLDEPATTGARCHHQPPSVRMLRISTDSMNATELGLWPQTQLGNSVFLTAGSASEIVVLSGSTHPSGFFGVVANVQGNYLAVSRTFQGSGVPQRGASLTDRGITVPIASSTKGFTNVFIPNTSPYNPHQHGGIGGCF